MAYKHAHFKQIYVVGKRKRATYAEIQTCVPRTYGYNFQNIEECSWFLHKYYDHYYCFGVNPHHVPILYHIMRASCVGKCIINHSNLKCFVLLARL